MADYPGVIPTIELTSAIPSGWQYTEYLIRDLSAAETFINDDFSKAGSFSFFKFISNIKAMSGAKASSYSDIFYNNYWSYPDNIELGLVRQDTQYTIYIFNSYFVDKSLNAIINTVPQADLTYGALPETYKANQEKSYPLLIHLSGSPDVNGYIQFTFEDNIITIKVTGDRLVQYAFEPITEFHIKHQLKTAKAETHYIQQERRQIDDNDVRVIQCKIIREDMVLDMILGYAQDKVIAFPIPVEKMVSSDAGSLQGLSVLHTSTNINHFFEFKNCSYILLYDGTTVEVDKITSVDYGTGTITLESPVLANFDGSDTKIYPVVLTWLQDFSQQQRTKSVNEYELTLKEAVINV